MLAALKICQTSSTCCQTLLPSFALSHQAVASLEGRLSSAQQEATTLRSQLQESLAAQAAAARQAESASHDAAQVGCGV